MHSWCMPRERQSMNLHARHVPGSWAYSWVYPEERWFRETREAEFGVFRCIYGGLNPCIYKTLWPESTRQS